MSDHVDENVYSQESPVRDESEQVDSSQVYRVGLDLGTNTTVFQIWHEGRKIDITPDITPSVVGYPKPGVIPGILPKNGPLIGDEAIQYRLHLNLKWPIERGYVEDLPCARDLLRIVRDRIDPQGSKQLWVVIGTPANASPQRQKELRAAVSDIFDRVLLVPEPFLAAMGLREEEKLGTPGYIDPTRNSLIVDIGAGTTDLCKIQGYYPTSEDQISIDKAGNDVDRLLANSIKKKYPDINISPITITRIKEKHSFVGDPPNRILVTIPVNGKPQELDLTYLIQNACQYLVPFILEAVAEIATRCDADSVEDLLHNIILTGGGSLIRNIGPYVEEHLRKEGFTSARVSIVNDYKRLVAIGSLKTAKKVRDDQWQILI